MLTKLRYLSDIPWLAVEQPFELFDYSNIDSGKITSCGHGVGDIVPIQDARRVTRLAWVRYDRLHILETCLSLLHKLR